MTRNLKRENLVKLSKIEVNGFKVDIANYIHNPSYDYDYPSLVKTVSEDEERQQYTRIAYFKHYDGTGEYTVETYSRKKADGNGWQVITDTKSTVVEQSNRFSMKRLQELTQAV